MVNSRRVALAAALALASLAPCAWAAGADDLGMPAFPAATDEGSSMVWLRDHTSLGVGRFVAFAPDNVTVVLTDEVSTRSPTVHRITFRQEATRLDFVSRTGGRSLRGSGEVDCATGSFRADKVELYSGTDLRGVLIASEGPEQAGRAPRGGSGPAQAVMQVCGGGASLAPLTTPVRRNDAAPPTTVASAQAAPARPAPPSPPPPPPPPPPRDEPSPLASFGPSSERTPLPPPPRRGPAPQSTPLPELAARKDEPERPAPSPPPAARNATSVAQIGAFATREAAERAYSRIAAMFPQQMAGKVMRVDTVMLNGSPMYRSYVTGFASNAEAYALCDRLMSASEGCFVRKDQ